MVEGKKELVSHHSESFAPPGTNNSFSINISLLLQAYIVTYTLSLYKDSKLLRVCPKRGLWLKKDSTVDDHDQCRNQSWVKFWICINGFVTKVLQIPKVLDWTLPWTLSPAMSLLGMGQHNRSLPLRAVIEMSASQRHQHLLSICTTTSARCISTMLFYLLHPQSPQHPHTPTHTYTIITTVESRG